MSPNLATILYAVGSAILFLAGIVSAIGLGFGKTSMILAGVSTLYATANVLLFVILPNIK